VSAWCGGACPPDPDPALRLLTLLLLFGVGALSGVFAWYYRQLVVAGTLRVGRR